jgi:hypothetical protein
MRTIWSGSMRWSRGRIRRARRPCVRFWDRANRFDLILLDRISKRPHRISDLLEVQESGWSQAAALDLDKAFERFILSVEARQAETVKRTAPAVPKGQRPKVDVPKYRGWAEILNLPAADVVEDDPEELAEAFEFLAGNLDFWSLSDDEDDGDPVDNDGDGG